MPGAVKHQCRGQRRTFLRVPTLGVLRIDLLRHAGLAVRHLVVRLAVDDPIEGVVVVAITRARRGSPSSERCSSCGVITASRIGWTKLESHCEPKPSAAGSDVLGEPVVVLQVLGDRDPSGELAAATRLLIAWSRRQPSGRSALPGAVPLCEHTPCRRSGVRRRDIPLSHIGRVIEDELPDLACGRNRAGCLPTVCRNGRPDRNRCRRNCSRTSRQTARDRGRWGRNGCRRRRGSPRCPVRGRA